MNDNNQSRRNFLKKAGAVGAGTVAVGTGTASARLSNEEVREKVKRDFRYWNDLSVGHEYVNPLYHPRWSWNATRFGGPSFAGVSMLLTGAKRPYLWRHEYKTMVGMLRRAAEPEGDKLIRETDHFARGKQPRSGGEWVMEGRIGGRYFEQEGSGKHWWADEKVTLVKVRGFDFADMVRQVI